MPDLTTVIPTARDSVAAILHIHTQRPETTKKGKVRPAKFGAKVSGSAFCIAPNQYLVTAYHVLRFRQDRERDPTDRFYAFVVPQNGTPFHHFPVTGFPLERPDLDIAVLELGPSPDGAHISALPVTFTAKPDGQRVLTMGFPAPAIGGLQLDRQGNFQRGQFFLKSHANEGIISAQYVESPANTPLYELNVGWHNGESGGPIIQITDQPAAFSLMQQYRNIPTQHGTMPGPHRGVSLSTIQQDLIGFGANVL